MRAIVTRHYKTRYNEGGRVMGWFDSPRGHDWKSDIDFVDARLREREIRFDSVCSSDLERSRQTALIHARNLGIAEIDETPDLKEINYGKLERTKKMWVSRFFPQHKKNPDLIYPSGESFRQMQRRSVSYLSSLAQTHADKTILIVMHAGVIRGLVSHFLGLDYAAQLEHKISFRYIGDFRFNGGRCKHYDELGEASGFIDSGVIDIPYSCQSD